MQTSKIDGLEGRVEVLDVMGDLIGFVGMFMMPLGALLIIKHGDISWHLNRWDKTGRTLLFGGAVLLIVGLTLVGF